MMYEEGDTFCASLLLSQFARKRWEGKKWMGREKEGELATATAIKEKGKKKVGRREVHKRTCGHFFWAAKREKKKGRSVVFFGW